MKAIALPAIAGLSFWRACLPEAYPRGGLRYAALVEALTVLGSGVAYAAVEKSVSTWDGVWWAITTMTTVGYGSGGRAITIVLLFVGIGFVAIVTGAVAERFLDSDIEEAAEATYELEATDADLLAEVREVRNRLDRLEAHLAGRSRA